MTKHPTIFQTIEFATTMHAGQLDKHGIPYIAHPLAVMRRVPPNAWHVAVLHDTMEDCGVRSETLHAMGYSKQELTALDALTRRLGEPYEAFIDRVINEGPMNGIAIVVKIADIDDNLEPWRNTAGTAEEQRRILKYRTARLKLEMALQTEYV